MFDRGRGRWRGRALLLVLALVAFGCGGAPRSGDSIPKIPVDYLPRAETLAEKAVRAEREIDPFLSPEGLLLYRMRPGRDRAPYRNFADQATWTGCLLAAECLRYRATGSPEALARARRILGGLSLLHDVTGVHGLFARCARPAPTDGRTRRLEWQVGAVPHEGYRWRADVSKDQYAGILFGLSAVLDHLPEIDRLEAGRLVCAVADHLLDHDMRLIDYDGEQTTFGDLSSHYAGLVPIGTNALIATAAVALARRARPGGRYGSAIRDLVEDGYAGAMKYPTFQLLGIRNRSNDVMAALAADALLGPDVDATVRRGAAAAVHALVAATRGEDNALIAAVAVTRLGVPAEEEARAGLALIPVPRPTRSIDNRGRGDVARSILPGRKFEAVATRPVPVNRRGASSFLWKSDPYQITADIGDERGPTYPPVDFLLPYWLLRARGMLDVRR